VPSPGVECRTREIVEGPNFTIFPTVPLTSIPVLYDEEGRLTEERLKAVAIGCLNQRPSEMAAEQDAAAINSPVGVRFIDDNPAKFHILNDNQERIFLSRLEITLRYQVRTFLAPFRFHQYMDSGAGKEIYSAAFAPINAGDLQGDILMRRVEGEHIEVIFVPHQP
jgi:hypothetical protein